jgi:HSP20 family protein
MTTLNASSFPKFSTFAEIEEMPAIRHFQDAVTRFLNEPGAGIRPWTPPVDILETENELILRMDLPGLTLEAIEIRLENLTLTIKGERKFEQAAGKGYHRIERSYGSFARTFTLPNTVDTEHVKADYKHGVLTVTIARREAAKPRTIRVDVTE